MLPSDCCDSRSSSASNSPARSARSAVRPASKCFRASRSASTWRRRAVNAPSPRSRNPASSRMWLRSASSPSPVRAESMTIGLSPSMVPGESPLRSILLRTIVTGTLSGTGSSMYSGIGSVASWIHSTASASAMALRARRIPSSSIRSGLSRRPAVSTSSTARPSMLMRSRNTSRVVPAISVTMAVSSPDKRFMRLDFPALGLPTMTTW